MPQVTERSATGWFGDGSLGVKEERSQDAEQGIQEPEQQAEAEQQPKAEQQTKAEQHTKAEQKTEPGTRDGAQREQSAGSGGLEFSYEELKTWARDRLVMMCLGLQMRVKTLVKKCKMQNNASQSEFQDKPEETC